MGLESILPNKIQSWFGSKPNQGKDLEPLKKQAKTLAKELEEAKKEGEKTKLVSEDKATSLLSKVLDFQNQVKQSFGEDYTFLEELDKLDAENLMTDLRGGIDRLQTELQSDHDDLQMLFKSYCMAFEILARTIRSFQEFKGRLARKPTQ